MWRGRLEKCLRCLRSSAAIVRRISPSGGSAYSPAKYIPISFACSSANGKIVGIACPSPTKTRSGIPGLNIRL